MNTPQNILRRDAVERMTGLPKSTLYAKVAAGEFPKPIKLGARAVGWLEHDIASWQLARIEARAA
ncbi:AlpA family phage regulatory protein [Mesorhizobium sp. KR9-304]|uniref:helix-turn-helix transcriptional regulator n=1 Tax=Mesorhizobium sp. KR9-304 TaxID=3156614 RepID=UPI0032B5296D